MTIQQLEFTNDFKILFCNGYSAISAHARVCEECEVYLRHGDGDLCNRGKELIARAMTLQFEH